MAEITTDYYELLQISVNADSETIHRVYRIQAQRFHPDNQETGDVKKFRAIVDAYAVLSDPEKRAQYDVFHQRQRQDRWKLVDAGRAERDRHPARADDAPDASSRCCARSGASSRTRQACSMATWKS